MAGRVALTPRGIEIDGRTRLLYGGEVQYYRIRDKKRDVAKTHGLWAEALDQLLAAGMNVVTTYVPWDLHEPREGEFTFEGLADLGRFLELCQERALPVLVKPGPFINSEWPTGIGSFGAVPAWFKESFPDALARRPDGKFVSTDLLGGARGRQPSYFAPEFLTATERWFRAVAPIIKRFVGERTIFGLQIDNETNFYFMDRYAADYSSHGVRHYRDWLRARYPDIAALDAAYGKTHGSFAQVAPPAEPPTREADPAGNLRHQDWFDAGKAGIADYHLALRAMWERLEIREPDIVFFTNDSPHTMPAVIGRENMLLWDAPSKNLAGAAMLDAYPKQFPTTSGPSDYPFLTSFFSKRFAQGSDRYAFAGGEPVATGKCYGAELEGGLFELPFLQLSIPVPPAATDHVLLQHLGRGSALAVVYVFRAGLNQDDSPYFREAAVGVDGRLQDRYQVLRRYGRLVRERGDALAASVEVEAPVAVALDSRFDAPSGGVPGHSGRAQVNEACAVFGWLEDAGLTPAIVDLRDVARRPDLLDPYRLIVFPNPDVVGQDAARALDAWVRGGGHLVNLLNQGRYDEHWQRGTDTERLLADGLLGEGQLVSSYANRPFAPANVNLRAPDGPEGALRVGPFLGRYEVRGATPLAFDRTFPFGSDGSPAGWTCAKEAGTVVHLGTNPAAPWATAAWFRAKPDALLRARAFARWLGARAGVQPLLSLAEGAGTAWARRAPAGLFVFVGGRLENPALVKLELHDLAALGLDAGTSYTVCDELTGADLGRHSGEALRNGLELRLGGYGTAVLRIA